MVKIEITIDDNGICKTGLLKDNLLVGWSNLLREEQLALLKGLSESFNVGLRGLNEA